MNSILKGFKKLLPDGLDTTRPLKDENAKFLVTYKDIKVGMLELKQGKWYFSYCSEFKNQTRLKPLIEFPDISKVYESEELWPFFAVRIPSLQQPNVQRIIKKEKIDDNNIVELLHRFGERTISNPFRLEKLIK